MKLKRNDVFEYVTEIVWQHDLTYTEAVLYVIENDGIDMTEMACHIKKIKPLFDILEKEADDRNSFVKSQHWHHQQAEKEKKLAEKLEETE